MDNSYKKVLPKDVFVSISPLKKKSTEADASYQELCPNKLSGVEFMDIVARLVWKSPHREIGYFASEMQLSATDFSSTVRALSGISFWEWRDQYLNLAACELLEYSDKSIGGVGKQLGFTSLSVFSKFFEKLNNIRPKLWRYHRRGFNTDYAGLRELKLMNKMREIERKMENDKKNTNGDTVL